MNSIKKKISQGLLFLLVAGLLVSQAKAASAVTFFPHKEIISLPTSTPTPTISFKFIPPLYKLVSTATPKPPTGTTTPTLSLTPAMTPATTVNPTEMNETVSPTPSASTVPPTTTGAPAATRPIIGLPEIIGLAIIGLLLLVIVALLIQRSKTKPPSPNP